MNEPLDPRSRLLVETLQQGDWVGGPASAMAQRAARQARRRRVQRKVVLTLSTATAIVAAVILVSHPRFPTGTAPAAPTMERGYEIISDDELVAELPDDAILVLPQGNGTRKIVLLDR